MASCFEGTVGPIGHRVACNIVDPRFFYALRVPITAWASYELPKHRIRMLIWFVLFSPVKIDLIVQHTTTYLELFK
jgi:hypothetical protein